MIFVFVLMMFGLCTTFRTLNYFVRERFLGQEWQFALLFFVFSVQLMLIRYVITNYWGAWIVSLLPTFIFQVCLRIFTLQREKHFKDNFCHLIDEVIVAMRSGQSFRTSLVLANEKTSPFVQQKMRKIIEMVRFKTSLVEKQPEFVEMMVVEFRKVDENTHNSLQRLMSLRHKIRTESDYRRKSGQATLQIRAQSGILCLLYIATAGFVFSTTPAKQLGIEIPISIALFFAGTALVWFYGRSYKWKV